MITRRRFLTMSAAASVALPASADGPLRWRGRALGADASLVIHAPRAPAEKALRDIRAVLRQAEKLFSLFDPHSRLSLLNQTGRITAPEEDMLRILEIVDLVHEASNGIFDPTVQPMWQALAQGEDPFAAKALIGWSRIVRTKTEIRLDPGQALTLNGIAQGYATDMAKAALTRAGLQKVLVNIGEYAAIGGPFRLGISDRDQGLVATQSLDDRAVATSSPASLLLDADHSHILNPQGAQAPLWSTVSVEADSAAIADAASTAFCFMSRQQIEAALPMLPGSPNARLVDRAGDLATLGQSPDQS